MAQRSQAVGRRSKLGASRHVHRQSQSRRADRRGISTRRNASVPAGRGSDSDEGSAGARGSASAGLASRYAASFARAANADLLTTCWLQLSIFSAPRCSGGQKIDRAVLSAVRSGLRAAGGQEGSSRRASGAGASGGRETPARPCAACRYQRQHVRLSCLIETRAQ